MRFIAHLILLAIVGCLSTGCAALVGKDEPGLKFGYSPFGGIKFEDTSNTSLELEGLEASADRNGLRSLKIERLTRSQEVATVRAQNVRQMEVGVKAWEQANVGVGLVIDGFERLLAMAMPLIGQNIDAGVAKAAMDAETKKFIAGAVADAVRAAIGAREDPLPPAQVDH